MKMHETAEQLVQRERLLLTLSASSQTIFICAPQGAGKTTLLRQFASRHPLSSVLISALSAPGDRDGLLELLLDELLQADVKTKRNTSPATPLSGESLARQRLILGIRNSHAGEPFTILMDNFEYLKVETKRVLLQSAAIHSQQLKIIIGQDSFADDFVLATSSNHNFPIIGISELAFDEDEARQHANPHQPRQSARTPNRTNWKQEGSSSGPSTRRGGALKQHPGNWPGGKESPLDAKLQELNAHQTLSLSVLCCLDCFSMQETQPILDLHWLEPQLAKFLECRVIDNLPGADAHSRYRISSDALKRIEAIGRFGDLSSWSAAVQAASDAWQRAGQLHLAAQCEFQLGRIGQLLQVIATGGMAASNFASSAPLASIALDVPAKYWRNNLQALLVAGLIYATYDVQKGAALIRDCHDLASEERNDKLRTLCSAMMVILITHSLKSYGELSRWIERLSSNWPDTLDLFEVDEQCILLAGKLASITTGFLQNEMESAPLVAEGRQLIQGTSPDFLCTVLSRELIDYYVLTRKFEYGIATYLTARARIRSSGIFPRAILGWAVHSTFLLRLAADTLGDIKWLQEAELIAAEAKEKSEVLSLREYQVLLYHLDFDAAFRKRNVKAAANFLAKARERCDADLHVLCCWQYFREVQLACLAGEYHEALIYSNKLLEELELAQYPDSSRAPYMLPIASANLMIGNYANTQRIAQEIAAFSSGSNASIAQSIGLLSKAKIAIESSSRSAPELVEGYLSYIENERIDSANTLVLPALATVCNFALEHGIKVSYVSALIERRKLPPPIDACSSWVWPVRVNCLGQFSIKVWGKELSFDGKLQRKPLELMRFLVCKNAFGHAPKAVHQFEVGEALWPGSDSGEQRSVLGTTIHRLRKLCGLDFVSVLQGKVKVLPGSLGCDLDDFRKLKTKALRGEQQAGYGVLDLYRGKLLGEELPPAWAIASSDEAELEYVAIVDLMASLALQKGDVNEAARIYEVGIGACPTSEILYRGLMRTFSRAGSNVLVQQTYERCDKSLNSTLAIKPSKETSDLFSRLIQQNGESSSTNSDEKPSPTTPQEIDRKLDPATR